MKIKLGYIISAFLTERIDFQIAFITSSYVHCWFNMKQKVMNFFSNPGNSSKNKTMVLLFVHYYFRTMKAHWTTNALVILYEISKISILMCWLLPNISSRCCSSRQWAGTVPNWHSARLALCQIGGCLCVQQFEFIPSWSLPINRN